MSRDKTLVVTTKDGKSIEGSCTRADQNSLFVFTFAGKSVQVRPDKVKRLALRPHGERPLKALHREVHEAMSDCVHGLLTPAGPFAAIGVGLVSAWAISATPFVLVGEAVRGPDTAREIEFHFEPPKTSKPGNQS